MEEEIYMKIQMADVANRHTDVIENARNYLKFTHGFIPFTVGVYLHNSYKEIVGELRSSRKILKAKILEYGDNKKLVDVIKKYLVDIEREIVIICNQGIALVEDGIPLMVKSEVKPLLLYWRFKADLCRYISEVTWVVPARNAYVDGMEAYEKCMKIAETNFPPSHFFRLATVFNFATFYRDIVRDNVKACRLLQKALMEAGCHMEKSRKYLSRSSSIIESMEVSLTLWGGEFPPLYTKIKDITDDDDNDEVDRSSYHSDSDDEKFGALRKFGDPDPFYRDHFNGRKKRPNFTLDL